ncbi:hypothetical protein LINPERPRIM_LOCUS31303, partial [Linum perenne]
MFILNTRDQKYQFFDNRSTAGFNHQWMTTGYRVIKHVSEYFSSR